MVGCPEQACIRQADERPRRFAVREGPSDEHQTRCGAARQGRETHDMGVLEEVHDRRIVVSYSQPGETIRGIDHFRTVLANYPGGLALAEVSDVHGPSEDVVVTSSLPFGVPIVSVSGADDSFILEGVGHYGADGVFNIAATMEIHGGKVTKETWSSSPGLKLRRGERRSWSPRALRRRTRTRTLRAPGPRSP